MRTIAVRYHVPVYVTVDLDAPDPDPDRGYIDEAIVRVFEDVEGIRRVRPALDGSFEADPVALGALTRAERRRALDIAERTIWPAWDS